MRVSTAVTTRAKANVSAISLGVGQELFSTDPDVGLVSLKETILSQLRGHRRNVDPITNHQDIRLWSMITIAQVQPIAHLQILKSSRADSHLFQVVNMAFPNPVGQGGARSLHDP